MRRKIIQIHSDRCSGCGLCVSACHEGALVLENGVARLVSDSYCDGLGDCLPECPAGAIEMVEREAAAYDEALVRRRQRGRMSGAAFAAARTPGLAVEPPPVESAPEPVLRNWPVQLALVSVRAPYLEGADLLVAADCTAYAYAGFHEEFLRGRVALIACPKLDTGDAAAKLAAIFREHEIRSVTVLRMEVPCCGGIVEAVRGALGKSGKVIEWGVAVVSTEGEILRG